MVGGPVYSSWRPLPSEEFPEGLGCFLVGTNPPGYRHRGTVVQLPAPGLKALLNPPYDLPFDSE